jgi:hypothetical protein
MNQADKSPGLGHYIFQLHPGPLVSPRWLKREKNFHLGTFTFFPIPIVFSKSSMFYDTYLLLPEFGLLELLLQIKERLPSVKY